MKNIKKKNNKGFTLIELLVVVVILLAISVMAISSISAAIERNKGKQNDAKIDVILSYAEIYFDDHKNSLIDYQEIYSAGVTDDGGKTKKITIPLDVPNSQNDIFDEFNLTDEEKKDADGNLFSGAVCCVYTYTYKIETKDYTYDDKKHEDKIVKIINRTFTYDPAGTC